MVDEKSGDEIDKLLDEVEAEEAAEEREQGRLDREQDRQTSDQLVIIFAVVVFVLLILFGSQFWPGS